MNSMQMKLELVIIPVSDVDRAKAFYTEKLGFHADFDKQVNENLRFVQLTPQGSACSIAIGVGLQTCRRDRKKGCKWWLRTREPFARNCSNEALKSARSTCRIGDISSTSAIPTAIAGPCSNSLTAHDFHRK